MTASTQDAWGVDVDLNRCEGHGFCEQVAPEVFRLDDAGELTVERPEVTGDLIERASEAARLCPVAAIKLRAIGGLA